MTKWRRAGPALYFNPFPQVLMSPTASTAEGWLSDEIRQPAALKPYARNARLHSDEQIDQLVASYREFGFVGFILVDEDGVIIAGHGRHAAALRCGLADVPVKVAHGWSEAKKRRFRLLDNKVAENSTWDVDLLGLELGDMRDDGTEIAGLGWGADALDELLSIGLGPDADSTEAPPAAEPEPSRAGNLSARFGIPPFTVLNAREGWWQDRKRAWLAIGIQSHLGRGEGATWGEHAGITEPGLNHYRNAAKAQTFSSNDRMAALQRTGDSRTAPHHTSGNRKAGAASGRPKKRGKAAPTQSETA